MKHSLPFLAMLTIVATQYGAQLWTELDQVDGSYQEHQTTKSQSLDPSALWVFDQADEVRDEVDQKVSSLQKRVEVSTLKEK